MFNSVTIIGVGLIGGSLAKVLKSEGLAGSITGWGRSRKTLELARELGVIDRIGRDLDDAFGKADLVVLASPVGTFEDVVREVSPHLKKDAILTDVGSVKGSLVRSIENLAGPAVRYVPAHPIAGKETFGVAEAEGTLFRGARCIMTPTEKTDTEALTAVREMWRRAGANVIEMDADLHDKIFAAVSHMPHVAAFAMMCAVSDLDADGRSYVDFSGAGFRDFTRIAGSSPEIWRDICLMNRDNVVAMIDRYQADLDRFKRELLEHKTMALEEHLKKASDARRGLE